MRKMERYLGLDLGTASLGWALIDFDGGERGKIVASGVRIFPEALDAKGEKTKNTARRNFRLGRRQTRRTRRRKEDIRQILHGAGLLPNQDKRLLETPSDHFTTEEGKHQTIGLVSPYALRQKSLEEKISLYDLGRVFFHLSRRIGFQETPTTDDDTDRKEKTKEEKAAEKEEKEAEKARENLGDAIKKSGKKTLGAYLADKEIQRGWHLSRLMITNEFEDIWTAQQKFYPDVLTSELKSELHGQIFDRRRTFWSRKTLGVCKFEPASPLLLKSEWLAQQCIMLQDLNNIHLAGGNKRQLDQGEREILRNLFETKAKVKFNAMRKALGFSKDEKFNFEVGADQRKELSGNATEAMLREVIDNFPMHPKAQIIREQIATRKWVISYEEIVEDVSPTFQSRRIEIRRHAEKEAAQEEFITNAMKDWGITRDESKKLAEHKLPGGWTRESEKVMRGLVEGMSDGTGKERSKVLEALYPEKERLLGEDDNLDTLPSHHHYLSGIRNPVVTRCLNETRKVVNNIIRTYGKPDYIRVELARDVKLVGKKKRDAIAVNRNRRDEKEEAKKFLSKRGLPDNPNMILKYMLWQETGGRDLYSGDMIGVDALFQQREYEIEHIMPQSRSRDDSFNNLLLCRKDYNAKKGNRTPFEAFGNDPEWENMVARVEKYLKPHPKKTRFLREKYDVDEDRAQAQLNDTAYAAKEVRDFLACLYPKSEAINRVQATNGRITNQLGQAWNVYRHFGKWFCDSDGTSNKKIRDDHRHHTLDATIIALTTPSLVKELVLSYKDKRERGATYEKILESLNFRPPWEGFHEELKTSLSKIIVSYKVDGKISGTLTDMTQLGRIKGEQGKFVKRVKLSALTPAQFLDIRDKQIQSILWKHLRKSDPELPENWLDFIKGKKWQNLSKVKTAMKQGFAGKDIPYTYNKDGSRHFPIKKVRIAVKGVIVPTKTPNSVYLKGDSHHTALYQKPDGTVEALLVNKIEAIKRAKKQKKGVPLIFPHHPDHPDWPLLFSLCKRDVLRRIDPDTGEVSYYRVDTLEAERVMAFHQYSASKSKEARKLIKNHLLIEQGYQKVSVDPIGRVRKAK